jgi:hypothetical protein
MNKILILLFLLLPFKSLSQGYKYFNKSHDQIVKTLNLNKNIEIMEDYPDYIHAVDDVKLNNLIFYLRDDKCYEVRTTYQKENDYDKVSNYLDVVYIKDEENVWHFDFDSGRQITYLQKKPGFFVTKDIFVPKEK